MPPGLSPGRGENPAGIGQDARREPTSPRSGARSWIPAASRESRNRAE